MYVCYGNENNCFGSQGDCDDLDIECSTDGSFDPGNCNCTQLDTPIDITTYDENENIRRFRINAYNIQIENAEGTAWVTFYDLAAIDTDKFFQLKYVSALNRIVITTYYIPHVEDIIANGAPYDFSSVIEDVVNVYYAD
jgi:hypothetical protein